MRGTMRDTSVTVTPDTETPKPKNLAQTLGNQEIP